MKIHKNEVFVGSGISTEGKSESQQNKKNKKQHSRAGAGHIGKLPGHATGKYKRNKTGKQMYTDGCHRLQSEKTIEVGEQKNKSGGSGKNERA